MAAFSLSTFLGNLIHLRPNQLGHSTLGNAIVGAVDNFVDPVLSGVVSNATGGLVVPVVSAPSAAAPTSTELTVDTVIAWFLQALVNSHNQAAAGAPVVAPPAAAPVTKAVVPGGSTLFSGTTGLTPVLDPPLLGSDTTDTGLHAGGLN